MFHSTTWRSKGRFAFMLVLPWCFGCATLMSLKANAPEAFAMERIADALYLERGGEPTARRKAVEVVEQGRLRVERFFGGQIGKPTVLAFLTEAGFASFGGGGARGVSLATGQILLSPAGLTVPIVAHELAHAEFHRRIGASRVDGVPRWFDEGLAVLVSQEPSHGEEQWARIQALKVPCPRLDELGSRQAWNAATKRYGDDNTSELHVVYATAGHAVHGWYARVGDAGFQALVDRLRAGETFEKAFHGP